MKEIVLDPRSFRIEYFGVKATMLAICFWIFTKKKERTNVTKVSNW